VATQRTDEALAEGDQNGWTDAVDRWQRRISVRAE
jgi:hypothetical protein